MNRSFNSRGFTLAELLISLAIGALLLLALQRFVGTSLAAMEIVDERTTLVNSTRFAMDRMVAAVAQSDQLFIPMPDLSGSNFSENIRMQTYPPSPPEGSSTKATAVLAINIDPYSDLDGDGIPDADNDGDGLIDEDLPSDIHNDGKAGIRDFDDDGNGYFDFEWSPLGDDDESNDYAKDEDPVNGVDDDGDGVIDEDPGADTNGDGAPGVAGIDDDEDGQIDEGEDADDDEDGLVDEDWYDPVVFYLHDASLIERRVVPWDENKDGTVNGTDYIESTLLENVSLVRFERVELLGGHQQLVDLTLNTIDSNGDEISLNTRVRLGSRR